MRKKAHHALRGEGSRTPFALVALLVSACLAAGCKTETVSPASNDDLTNPLIIPRVVFSLPADNSVGPFDLFDPGDGFNKPYFVVRFNKLMNAIDLPPNAVTCTGFDRQTLVHLYPFYFIYPRVTALTSSRQGAYDDVLAFVVNDASGGGSMRYSVGRSYTVTIDTALEDINGNHPAHRYSFTYVPEPNFRVVRIFPEDGAADVQITGAFVVMFNSPVGPSVLGSLQIAPQPPGSWALNRYDSSLVVFQRTQQSPYAIRYVLSVLSNATDIFGHRIDKPYAATFTTTPFEVEFVYPQSGATLVDVGSSIQLYLSGIIDTSTVRPAFSITPPVAGQLFLQSGSIGFTPSQEMSSGTTYSVAVSSALHATDGTALIPPFSSTFTTEPFEFTGSSPTDGSIEVDRHSTLYAYFSAFVDTASVRSSFSIAPPIGIVLGVVDQSRTVTITPAIGYAARTTYVATFSTSLRSKGGVNLPSAATVTFTTGQ